MKDKKINYTINKNFPPRSLNTLHKYKINSNPITNHEAQESEIATLKKIISLMPGQVYWKDLEGKYLGCNINNARICNLTPEEFIGKRLSDIFPANIAMPTEAKDLEIMRSGESYHFEEVVQYDDLSPATFLSEKTPLRNSKGEIIGLLGVSFDITERKQIEEELKLAKERAEASSRAKSQFLAVINHELRTPLTSILGLAELIKRGDLPQNEQKSAITNIENCTKHLLNLVEDVLEFSRLETGNLNLHIKSVNLNTLQLEIHNMLLPLAEKKGLSLTLDVTEFPSNVLTDARFLRQIFINLVMNAIKFTEKGSVTIKAHLIAHQKSKMLLNMAIIDTGTGIPEDKLDIIFEPFQQLENAFVRQSSRGGTGLGLSIVKKLAAHLKADLKVESRLGEGSTFSLACEFKTTNELDMRSIQKKNARIKNEELPIDITPIYPDERPYRPAILLIEDDAIIQYIHSKMLRDLGCEVTLAVSAKEALEQLHHEYHIIFVDLSLPDTSGIDFIKKIRNTYQLREVPVIALTAYDGKDHKKASLEAGADLFKSKPISQANLKELMLKYLK